LIKKITEKDKKDWINFLNNKEKLNNKDNKQNKNQRIYKVIDLHGYSLQNANKTIDEFIKTCFSQKVSKINVITGKGSRSKNKDNPYQSENFGILKHSVPEYIKTNSNLMKMIKEINFEDIENPSKGSFDILLKKNNK
tara:strand:- start:85 stop:498 length:414 start_codon:yes stop_codon:yes gene_type:complete